jgi:hypothetical protein
VPDVAEASATVPPVLAFEERMARRTRAGWWIKLTSSLAGFELGATAVMAVSILVWCAGTYITNPDSRTTLSFGLLVSDGVLAGVAILAILLFLRLQDGQAKESSGVDQ